MIGKKIKLISWACALFCTGISFEASAALRAVIDRAEISIEESVSLKIVSEQSGTQGLDPQFTAPDFEVINQFESSNFSAVYINGKFENKSEKSFTFILRPLKVGSLKISNIKNPSTQETAPDIIVRVTADSGPPRKGLDGPAPSLKGDAKNFFVKAEISNPKPFQGEQVVVSYYLYRRTRTNVREVMQYPSFQGFIREDLEMPILSGRMLDYEAVSLGGVPFERALLARYAVYPIKTGKLKIDGLNIRADYVPKDSINEDMFDDPFFQFFSQVTPRTGTSKSDPINVEVLPLPEEGKSPAFTGGVGNFEVSASIDAQQVRAGEPVTMKVLVRGKGNTNLIELPKISWPAQVRFFESQGRSRSVGQGVTEKTFDVVFIPLEKGSLALPQIQFEFFNPESKAYQKVSTQPISLDVLEGDPNTIAQMRTSSAPPVVGSGSEEPISSPSSYGKLRLPDPKNSDTGIYMGQPWWRYVGWGSFIIILALGALLVWDETRKRSYLQLDLLKKKQDANAFWDSKANSVETLAQSAQSVGEFSEIMEEVTSRVYSAIDQKFGINSKSISRRELVKILTESHQLNSEMIQTINATLELSELVRFVSSAGVLNLSDLKLKVSPWLQNAKQIVAELSNKT